MDKELENDFYTWKKRAEEYYSQFSEKSFDTASQEEDDVNSRMYDFGERFFSDMMFEPDSIVGKYLECKSKDGNSDREVTDYIPIPELQSFSYDMIICKIKSLGKDYMACFDSKEMSLTISPNYTDRDYVILHEMIHIHEFLLSKINASYRDILFYELYKKVSNSINNINKLLDSWCNGVNQLGIQQKGGIHSPLFLLKSLDIDLQCGYKLGTTMGYGCSIEFEKVLNAQK